LLASRHLFDRGIHIPAIRPPSVPAGTSRLRIALSAAHDVATIHRLKASLAELP
jgi:8-amino-7-oxononanoate synthase